MVTREMQERLEVLTRGFPVITITGPRQSGKTTLARMAYPDHAFIDLESLITRQRAKEDPASLFGDGRGCYILDEFQYVPELLSHVKVLVDRNQIAGQFVLTGSNQFSMMKDVSQSLAGRTAILELLPFSYREAYPEGARSVYQVIYNGMYPRLVAHKMDAGLFYDSYISTYLQRDVRMLSNVQDLDTFSRFLALCAGRTGSILNKESLANDVGVDGKTVSKWLSLLQTSYIVYMLKPWHGNLSKRLIKSPKLYFYDTGLACRLLEMRDADDLAAHPLRGNLFENYVVAEILKHFYNSGTRPPLTFYRESNGTEVDLLIERGGRLVPIEIKSAATINSSFYRNLLKFAALGLNADKGTLVYSGAESWENENCRIVGWREVVPGESRSGW